MKNVNPKPNELCVNDHPPGNPIPPSLKMHMHTNKPEVEVEEETNETKEI